MLASLIILSIQPALVAPELVDATDAPSDPSTDDSVEPPIWDLSCEAPASTLTLNRKTPVQVRCPANCDLSVPVWGTTRYTDDSAVCVAAIHATKLSEQGGVVSVYQGDQNEVFIGSTSNGVTSQMSGAWPASFQFEAVTAQTEPRALSCRTTLAALGASFTKPGAVLEVSCPAACNTGGIWGTSIYTSDSAVCTAAVHAGALPLDGGVTKLYSAPGQLSYPGSEQNGVASSDWGNWSSSFLFANALNPADEQRIGCKTSAQSLGEGPGSRVQVHCPPGCEQASLVIGSEVYTDDSSICRAAIHAGVLGLRGGSTTIELGSSVQSLPSETKHGITSRSWGPWYRTFRFVTAPDSI